MDNVVLKARGRTSKWSHVPGIRKFAVELIETHYADFGPALATEALADRHATHVGRETLRRWMMAEGVWLSRKQRKTFHQPRFRRESYGELVQIDGSEHRWFEGRAEPFILLVFVDNAHEHADPATVRTQQEHGVMLPSSSRRPARAWLPCRLLLRMVSWRRRASSLEAWAALQVYQREQLRSAKIFESPERSHYKLPLHFT